MQPIKKGSSFSSWSIFLPIPSRCFCLRFFLTSSSELLEEEELEDEELPSESEDEEEVPLLEEEDDFDLFFFLVAYLFAANLSFSGGRPLFFPRALVKGFLTALFFEEFSSLLELLLEDEESAFF